MNRSKIAIKKVINRVLNEEREALKDTLDHEDISDVAHAAQDTWEGGEMSARWDTDEDEKAPEQGNLVLPVDRAKLASGEPSTREIEVIDHSTGKVVKRSERSLSLEETKLRAVIRSILKEAYL